MPRYFQHHRGLAARNMLQAVQRGGAVITGPIGARLAPEQLTELRFQRRAQQAQAERETRRQQERAPFDLGRHLFGGPVGSLAGAGAGAAGAHLLYTNAQPQLQPEPFPVYEGYRPGPPAFRGFRAEPQLIRRVRQWNYAPGGFPAYAPGGYEPYMRSGTRTDLVRNGAEPPANLPEVGISQSAAAAL